MKTKEDILAKRIIKFPEPDRLLTGGMDDKSIKRNVYAAMQEYADEKSKDFAKWLSEMTTIIKEPDITLYRYCNNMNEWGNYTLDDIYLEYQEHLKRTA